MWHFSSFLDHFGHFFGCYDHIYATNLHRANPDTGHMYGRCYRPIVHLLVPIWRRGVQNMVFLGVKTGLLWQACNGVRTQPGNHFMRHITSHYVAKHVFGSFLMEHMFHLQGVDMAPIICF